MKKTPHRMSVIRRLTCTLLLGSLALTTAARGNQPAGYQLTWSDEFDGATLDSTKWSILTGTALDATRTAEAVSIGGGMLTLKTYTEDGIHHTGFIGTQNKYMPLYGYMEARIDFNGAPGMWSAFWLMSPTISTLGDPSTNGVEMDIVEHRQKDGSGADISNVVQSALHWDGYGASHKSVNSGLSGAGLATGFHTYALEWTPEWNRYYIDGVFVWRVNRSTALDPAPPATPVSQRSQYFYLSSEVQNANWAGNVPDGGYGSKTASTTGMIVDYVRHYQFNPASVPPPPSFFAADAGDTQVKLTWDTAVSASSYTVKRSTTSGGPYTTIASGLTATNLASTGYTDTAVVNSTTYFYVVTAVNANGESASATELSGTPRPETIVDNADASGVTITGSWTASTFNTGYYGSNYLSDGNTGATGGRSVRFTPNLPATGRYAVYARWTAAGSRASNVPVEVNHATGVSAFSANEKINNGIWVLLGTFNFNAGSAGNVLIRNDGANGFVIVDAVKFVFVDDAPQTPPTTPAGVTAAGTSSSQIVLAWTASPGATSYNVKRATSPGGPYTTIPTGTAAPGYSDTPLSSSSTYYYVVSATNQGGESADSIQVLATTPAFVPAAPTGLVTTAGNAQVGLSWSASSGAVSYIVKRATASGGPYATIASGLTATSYTDTSVVNNLTYYYVVSGVAVGGEGVNSIPATARPEFSIIVDNAANTGVTITGSWSASSFSPGFYGTNYLSDGNTGATGGRSVRFTPNLPAAGNYQVYTRWTASANRATNVPVDITSISGTTTIVVNEQLNNGVWVLLGNFNFGAGTTGNVRLRNDGTNGFVIADAVKFVLLAPTITSPATASGSYGTPFSYATTATGSPASYSASGLPDGLSLDTGTGIISGTPAAAGSFDVTLDATNSAGKGTLALTLTVAKAPALVSLGSLGPTYDGGPHAASATTTPSGLAVTFTYDGNPTAPTYPGAYTVVATIDDPNYAGSAHDTLAITITALVRHAPTLNGDIDGSLQILLPESVTLNGNALVSGDLLVPGTPNIVLNGHPTYDSTLDGTGSASPAGYSITLNGTPFLRHIVRRTDAIAMPSVAAPALPVGTRSVSINDPGQSAGDFATLRNLTLNGNAGVIAVPPGTYGTFVVNRNSCLVLGVDGATEPAIYDLQELTLNSGSTLIIAGPVILTLASGTSINNGSVVDLDHPGRLTLRIASGGLTLNGSSVFHGFVNAPAGTVTVNGNSDLAGGVICDRLVLNGNGLLRQGAP